MEAAKALWISSCVGVALTLHGVCMAWSLQDQASKLQELQGEISQLSASLAAQSSELHHAQGLLAEYKQLAMVKEQGEHQATEKASEEVKRMRVGLCMCVHMRERMGAE
jgi:hypothetical protein